MDQLRFGLKKNVLRFAIVVGLPAFAQLPPGVDAQSSRQTLSAGGSSVTAVDAVPRSSGLPPTDRSEEATRKVIEEDVRLDRDIRGLKLREKGPRRFSADLFDVRQRSTAATDGGVSEDYVLGVGDRLQLNVFGSATFDLPVQVDGRGELVIPKVGTARVAGRSLAQAKQVVQGLVGRNFSRSTVDLQVIKLREVRVFIMGEVYKPGAYLLPSLCSLVNVLSLAGGPTALGSYRDIRVMRGGKPVFSLDLYPLRSEGLGNPNFSLQSGDVIFVPLAPSSVLLEGAFPRVALQPAIEKTVESEALSGEEGEERRQYQERLQREATDIETRLGISSQNQQEESLRQRMTEAQDGVSNRPSRTEAAQAASAASSPEFAVQLRPPLPQVERQALEDRLIVIRQQLNQFKPGNPWDARARLDPRTKEPLPADVTSDWPEWLQRWERSGIPPRMAFELKPMETVSDAMRFAGGLLPEAGEGTLVVRSRGTEGVLDATVIAPREASTRALKPGDVLSALPRRESLGRVVTLTGWVRVPGPYARLDGLGVGDLLKRDQQVLPDTYVARGEITRTDQDGRTSFHPFDVARAMAGDPMHNIPLQDRDRVELFRIEDLRERKVVTVLGPLPRAGVFIWHEGMRAADLLFRAGLPKKSANLLIGELAHSSRGGASQVIRLDLTRLTSTEKQSPVALLDDTINPLVQPDDQLSVYEKPGFRIHRTVRISGQVVRPGEYALDEEHSTFSRLIQRAGGLTGEAMPKAGIFLRRLEKSDTSLQRAAEESGLNTQDPTAKGVNEILERLNETKRQPTSGQLLKNPVLHGLATGSTNRLVVNFEAAIKADPKADVELQDGDEIIIPRYRDAAYVVGETASPFATYKVSEGMKVKELLELAGGVTRNADRGNIRLLKADGRIIDTWVYSRKVEPGDTVLVPQRIRRDSSWQENLAAMTPIALILNAIK
jgi:protein involved in polysaccharide export with SLBB domain